MEIKEIIQGILNRLKGGFNKMARNPVVPVAPAPAEVQVPTPQGQVPVAPQAPAPQAPEEQTYVEREINLALINDKLNHIISRLG